MPVTHLELRNKAWRAINWRKYYVGPDNPVYVLLWRNLRNDIAAHESEAVARHEYVTPIHATVESVDTTEL